MLYLQLDGDVSRKQKMRASITTVLSVLASLNEKGIDGCPDLVPDRRGAMASPEAAAKSTLMVLLFEAVLEGPTVVAT